jgi:hypothetical protein
MGGRTRTAGCGKPPRAVVSRPEYHRRSSAGSPGATDFG